MADVRTGKLADEERQTLYIFIGVAVVVGVVTGVTIHGVSKVAIALFGLDRPLEKPWGKASDLLRPDHKGKKVRKDPVGDLIRESIEVKSKPPPINDEMLDWIKREQGRERNSGMIPNTILEEDDSSESGL